MATKSKTEEVAAEAAAAEAEEKIDNGVVAKKVNAWIKAVEAETKVKQQYGPYKADDVLEAKIRGDHYSVVMKDYRKFTVEV